MHVIYGILIEPRLPNRHHILKRRDEDKKYQHQRLCMCVGVCVGGGGGVDRIMTCYSYPSEL